MSSIKDFINEYHISIYKLSKETGIPYSTISDLVAEITPIENTSSGTLFRLASYFNVSMESFFKHGSNPAINIYNEKRNVHILFNNNHIQYLGPKNLISFKKVNCIVGNTIYIDTYFSNSDGNIYVEEDYIDTKSLFDEYNITEEIDSETKVIIGKPHSNEKLRIIDECIMVSDSMAIMQKESSTDEIILEIININRTNNCMTLRLKDYTILSTNMSSNMQKRAIESAKRNRDIIYDEIYKGDRANA